MSNLLRTQLFEEHVALNAKIVPFAGWEMPIQYSSVKDECLAVRNEVGIFDVSHMGEFMITGPEAVDYVDYLITNDFKNSPVGKAVYSPLCNSHGTIIDDLICYKLTDNKVLVCVNASNIDKDFKWFSDNKKNFKCELVNDSNNYSLIAIQGPKSVEHLKKIGFKLNFDQIEYYGVCETQLNGEPIILARTGYTGEDGFEVFGSHNSIKSIWAQFIKNKILPCGLAARDVLRLEVCYPLYGHELNDTITPLDAGLKWTVKSDKIKFIGKEAIEGSTPKYKLLKITVDKGIPREGYEILQNNRVIGKVTSGTMSVVLGKGIAFGLVEAQNFKPSEEIFVNIRNKLYGATINKKPFLTGGHK